MSNHPQTPLTAAIALDAVSPQPSAEPSAIGRILDALVHSSLARSPIAPARPSPATSISTVSNSFASDQPASEQHDSFQPTPAGPLDVLLDRLVHQQLQTPAVVNGAESASPTTLHHLLRIRTLSRRAVGTASEAVRDAVKSVTHQLGDFLDPSDDAKARPGDPFESFSVTSTRSIHDRLHRSIATQRIGSAGDPIDLHSATLSINPQSIASISGPSAETLAAATSASSLLNSATAAGERIVMRIEKVANSRLWTKITLSCWVFELSPGAVSWTQ